MIINVQNLVKKFPIGSAGFFTALKGISLQVQEGEFTGLVGPSGSGKTTLLNIIGTLDKPTEGAVTVLGKNLVSLSSRESALLRKEQMGFIFQSYNLLPVYTVFENVEFPLLLLNIGAEERKKRVLETLDWVGLSSKLRSRPPQLSGGESQRVAIARAMVKRPKLVLADEPTANLDAENSYHILRTMLQLNRELGTCFVFATHDDKVISYLRRVIRLEDGQVVRDDIIPAHEAAVLGDEKRGGMI